MSIRQVDFPLKEEYDREMHLPAKEKHDFHGTRGCCKTCGDHKYNMHGYQTDVWLGSKHFDCLCVECKCTRCTWYYNGKCWHGEVML